MLVGYHPGAAIALPTQDIQKHTVRDLEARLERLRGRALQPLIDRLIPVHIATLGRLALHQLLFLLRVRGCLGLEALILDYICLCLHLRKADFRALQPRHE